MTAFLALVRRDLQLAMRQGSDAALVLIFYLLAVLLFPFGVGPEPNILARIATGVLWVTALLAALLALERLFVSEYEDGSLDQLALLPLPLSLVVLAKVLAHWLLTGLPLTLLAPFLAIALGMDEAGYPVLVLALALQCTPTLSLIGAPGAALTLGARRGACAAGAARPAALHPRPDLRRRCRRCIARRSRRRSASGHSRRALAGGNPALSVGNGGGLAASLGIACRPRAVDRRAAAVFNTIATRADATDGIGGYSDALGLRCRRHLHGPRAGRRYRPPSPRSNRRRRRPIRSWDCWRPSIWRRPISNARAANSWPAWRVSSTARRAPSMRSSRAGPPRTAFLTTEGHRDILLLREGGRLDPYDNTPALSAPLRAARPHALKCLSGSAPTVAW